MQDNVQFRPDGAGAILTLARPDNVHALNRPMLERLIAHLDMIDASAELRALLITGAGRAFSAGQDLADPTYRAGRDFDIAEAIERPHNAHIRRLRGLRIPTIAAVNGVAAGAGANLALACD